jgi:uncharacterized membrane protein YfcA
VEIIPYKEFIQLTLIAFGCNFLGSGLGMGYGMTITPILLIMGFDPLQIVPAVLLSHLVAGIAAGFAHHKFGNVNFNRNSQHLHIVFVFTSCAIVGTLAAVYLAINLSEFYLKLYIASLIIAIGIFILATLGRHFTFSWKKITALGLVAAFNKGISGGGYGPIAVGGQLLLGINTKHVISIAAFAEGLTCIVGVSAYLVSKGVCDWSLSPPLMVGAVLSVPVAAYSIKKIDASRLKFIIGIASLILGVATLIRVLT